ncbi:hypothetical protein E6W39_24550 [Kitasatospora acidiphila]|uniref:Integral membrane protein n=1 Tax=Kitasatospora acidiphila TaxID=2567942 RepID=A0A540W720_9ACTN|nr:hypothetical protein [Kitasatospora acidiphila]TQF04815.1 hypothetical protein E6W39_24550 [Kitasatospora acidiphila]
MYGPVPTAPPRGRGVSAWRVLLRVLLTVVPVLSIGIMAWVSMLWLALVHRRTRDWLMLALAAATAIGGLALIGPSDGQGWQTTAGMVLLLGTAVFVPAYFLAVELRPQRAVQLQSQRTAEFQPQRTAELRPQQWTLETAPGQGIPVTPPAQGNTVVLPPLQPGYPPVLPRQDRIGEVRAGLDELSAYLQRQDGS